MRDQVVENFPTARVLRYQVDGGLRLHHLVESGDMGMGEQLQYWDLAKRLGQIVVVEACFVDDFDGNLKNENEF